MAFASNCLLSFKSKYLGCLFSIVADCIHFVGFTLIRLLVSKYS